MSALAEVITGRRDAIVERWTKQVRAILNLTSLPSLELVDHVPGILAQIALVLRRASGVAPASAPSEDHGTQRLRLGFSVGAVVQEYGALRDAIVAEAEAEKVAVANWELNTLFRSIVDGIADAVSQYARERDAELQRQMNEHFAFVAHELRNPLSTARVSLDLLKRKGVLPEHRAAATLERSLRKTGELVDHYLRIARTASGIELRREPVSLRAVIDGVVAAVHPHADEKGVALSVELQDERPVNWDARLVHSALDNIVRNAVKFTQTGDVSIRVALDGVRATIEVEDCCGGVTDEHVANAFNPFLQFGADRSGFGLGLAIAKQAVDAHGGSIRIQNLPGKGCIVAVELPLN